MEPARRPSVSDIVPVAEPRTSKRALSPRRKDIDQSDASKRRSTQVSPQRTQTRVSASQRVSRKPKAQKKKPCPYDPFSEEVIAALIQGHKKERNAAVADCQRLGITWEFDFDLTPQQLLIRVLAPSKTLAKLDKQTPRPTWLIQSAPDSQPVPLSN